MCLAVKITMIIIKHKVLCDEVLWYGFIWVLHCQHKTKKKTTNQRVANRHNTGNETQITIIRGAPLLVRGSFSRGTETHGLGQQNS
jgi:hypothetical protein